MHFDLDAFRSVHCLLLCERWSLEDGECISNRTGVRAFCKANELQSACGGNAGLHSDSMNYSNIHIQSAR